MNTKSFITASLLVATLGGTAALSACGSGSAPNAALVVASDGYSKNVQSDSPAQLQTDFGDTASQVSSAASGVNSAGNEEVAVVFNNAADLQSAEADAQAEFTLSGLTEMASGATMRVTGTPAEFANTAGGL